MAEDDFEYLQIPNGISLDDNSIIKIELAFDGEKVTYRGEDGILMESNTLCYLDLVLRIFSNQLIDADGNITHPEGITPGHVMCHLIQHLHEISHQVEVQQKLIDLSSILTSDGSKDPLEILAAAGLTPLSAFIVGPDGVKEITKPEDLLEATSGEEPEEGEIIVHGIRNGQTKH